MFPSILIPIAIFAGFILLAIVITNMAIKNLTGSK
jgi:nitrogen fixation-related uncharacterized protein